MFDGKVIKFRFGEVHFFALVRGYSFSIFRTFRLSAFAGNKSESESPQAGHDKECNTIRIFYSLRYRDYALFWATDLLGSLGHFVQEVALYWITYEITGSAMALGVLGLCSALPRLILGALSGVIKFDLINLILRSGEVL